MEDVSRKIAISQRWDAEFQAQVKTAAAVYGVSMTQLTIDALELFVQLSQFPKFVELNEEERLTLLIETVHQTLLNPDLHQERRSVVPGELHQIGSIKQKIATLLRSNPDHLFRSTEIAHLLNLPQSTVRLYLRQLGEEDEYVLVQGRPNRIRYVSTTL